MPANRLSFQHRLHNRHEYLRFFDRSEVFRFGECVVFRVPNSLAHFRLGITLKARGSSIERNRVKRVVREVFRIRAALLGNYDYNVVIPSGKKMAFPYPTKLRRALEKGLEKELSRELAHR